MARQTTLSTEQPAKPDRPPVKWYRRPWIVPLFAIVGMFVLLRLPVYLMFDASDSFLELRSSFPDTHYALIALHVIFGSIAIITCAMQIWPWLRKRHPRFHRTSGRIYVLGGVLPGGVMALVVSVIAVQEVPGTAGNIALALLWLGTTFAGFRAARQRRFGDHRRWMIRSFALCMSIVVNRLWIAIWFAALTPFADGVYGGDTDLLLSDAVVAAIWSSWIVNLMLAQWWLDRRPERRNRSAAPRPVEVA